MANSNTVKSGGVTFLGMLGLLFIGLKLTGSIDWSWWWVLAPLWIPTVLGITLIGLAVLVYRIVNKRV